MNLNRSQPPFWPQSTTSSSSSSSMPRRRSSAPPLLTLPILIIILPIFALLFLFFVVPPFLSATSHILRPYHTVKKGWDSLNIVLVLFAILCGVLARRNDDGSDTNQPDGNGVVVDSDKNDRTHSQQWFEHYSERKVYDPPEIVTVTGTRRLRRSSSSYPDLRQDSLWETGDDRFRFFDDFDIQHKFRSPAVPDNNYARLRRTRSDFEESQDKVIPVDTFVLRSSPLTPPPKSPTPPPPPPPPPPVVRHKSRRTYQTVGRKERSTGSDVDTKKVESAPPPPPPPPPRPAPPPPAQTGLRSEQKYVKLERKKSNATKEIKMVLASLYNQRKRKKKQKTKNTSEFDNSFHSPSEQPQYSTVPPPSPPPPPPPPPPSVFHNLFRKNSKSKKVHSVPPPAPPPPPPRSSKRKGHAPPPPPAPAPAPVPPTPPRQPQPSRRRNAGSSGKPPLPTRANNLYDENTNSGNQSPLNRIPQAPPPPPFKMPELRFAVRGDFVSIHSSNSSRCSSPDLDEVDPSSTHESPQKVNITDGGGGAGSVFCPSPDVNAKADTFIARLRDEWRLEKMNSIKEKRNMCPPYQDEAPATRHPQI